MHRFFCPKTHLFPTSAFISDPKEIHHLQSVLRLKIGDAVVVFDGEGNEGEGTIKAIREDRIDVSLEKLNKITGSHSRILLACAIPKKTKFETVIEKCTELGVDEIIPMVTKRTEFKLTQENRAKKSLRYQTIAVNASKQSQRRTVPRIHPVQSLQDSLSNLKGHELSFIPCLEEKRVQLIDLLKKEEGSPSQINFFIGPEGDFTAEEITLAIRSGCRPVSLGQTVLKVETAAIAVCCLSRFFFPYER